MIGELVSLFNQQLAYYTELAVLNNPDFTFYYLDTLFDLMLDLAFSDAYHDTFGQACEDDTIIYDSQTILFGGVSNCHLDGNLADVPYLFWNSPHLASPGQQTLAKAMLDWALPFLEPVTNR